MISEMWKYEQVHLRINKIWYLSKAEYLDKGFLDIQESEI